LETSLGAIARIQAFEEDTPREPEVEKSVDVPAEWPASVQLTFDNVWASYHPDAEKPDWSLRNATFQINAGERVAVCGRTGAGKSTLLLSLLGLIETPRGTISLDGISISRVRRSLLRSRLHVISQDAFIQGEAVREALDPQGNVLDEVINEVLRDCALLDKINTSGGLSANFDDINLLVGETQLLVLARTVLQARSKPRGGVVLLDEATSRYIPLHPPRHV
jgi:ABC-type multidrug transport system fused ATPase/permease subunit